MKPKFRGLAKLATPLGRLATALLTIVGLAIAMSLWQHAYTTKVDGHLIMINSGARDTIDCNDGYLKLDGDRNTYTVTGHCRRLEIFGSENRVVAESAEAISVFGDSNVVGYYSGAPTVIKTGPNNTVSQRPRGH
ncbi:DUF3060 domain-containing protein [Mycobacterium intermedium]|nr:DUF3060 domain-containing protein [Mycobacterium intermedium]MCV6964750.1 DUF3060 domain-containing protein [Mycobacterium intermedium]ODR03080.1 hypothetical protein BHQ20_01410 [Mycobacterium intermedium]